MTQSHFMKQSLQILMVILNDPLGSAEEATATYFTWQQYFYRRTKINVKSLQ